MATSAPRGRPVLGYAGFLIIVGEAHVSTVALDLNGVVSGIASIRDAGTGNRR